MSIDLKETISKLPDEPGVYLFKDNSGKILYIGKATSLRDRVRSYFVSDIQFVRSPLIAKMVLEAEDIAFQKTDSVLEALILEASLIKKHQPLYNTKEKDNKSFNYVVITKEDLPRILMIRGRDLDSKLKAKSLPTGQVGLKFKVIYGPFPHGRELVEALRIVRKIFPFHDEKSKSSSGERFYRQLGLSPESSDEDAKKEYAKTIRNLKLFFEGKKKTLKRELVKDMKESAHKQEFEKAQEIKRKIFALDHIQDVALIKENKVTSGITIRIEAYDIAHMAQKDVVGVMVVIEDGEAKKTDYRKFNIKEAGSGDVPALKEILERRLAHSEWPLPKVFVVDGGKAQKNAFEKILNTYGIKIPVVATVKNDQHKVRELLGDSKIVSSLEKEIVFANSEAHRFAIAFHRKKREVLK